ncbi:MAG: CARDB domain-containing protein [Methanomassiliicoccales archaeon]
MKKFGRIAALLIIITVLIINCQPQIGWFLNRISLTYEAIVGEERVSVENLTTQAQTIKPDQSVIRQFKWQAENDQWSWQIPLNLQGYQYYKKLPRIQTDDYSVYVTNPTDDVYLSGLVQKFRTTKAAAGLTEYQMISLVVGFVQSIPYVEDKVGTGQDEYPKYPIETLYEQSGDCEDKSILMASLLDELGYGAVLLALPNHMAVGVKGANSLPGTYFTYQGARYYYLETTGKDWKIGDVPTEVVDSKARILALVPRPVLIHQWQSSGSVYNYQVTATVENQGTGTADNTTVYVAFDANGSKVYSQSSSKSISIPPGSKATFTVKLQYPRKVKTRIHVKVLSHGILDGETTSEWFITK